MKHLLIIGKASQLTLGGPVFPDLEPFGKNAWRKAKRLVGQ